MVETGVHIYTGDPDCDAAHAVLLKELRRLSVPFVGPGRSISLSQRGNLGEFISLYIAGTGAFKAMETFAQNALQPLSGISGAGIDLVHVYFDPVSIDGDLLFVQEVKTTGAADLDYLTKLGEDYGKLFSTDPNLTLQTRIQGLANSFEIERNRDDYAERVLQLGATTARECTQVRLIPTGVHELGTGNSVRKMLAIKSILTAFGWQQDRIQPWAISLGALNDRLLRLARGRS